MITPPIPPPPPPPPPPGHSDAWEQVALWLLLGTGAAVAAIPLWTVEFLAFQDLPGHLATVRALADMHDPSSPLYGHYFRPQWLLPNAVFFYATWALSTLVGISAAAKLLFTAYCFALPASVAVFFRSVGASPWMALGSLLLIYNDPFGYGFASFALGLPVLFFWLAVAHRHASRPTPRRGWAVAVGLVLLFLSHAQIFLTAGLFGVVLVALSWEGPRVLWQRLWPYILGSLPFLAWFLRFFVFPPDQGLADVTFGGLQSALGFTWSGPRLLLEQLRTDVLMGFADQSDETALLALGIFTLVVLVGRRGHRPTQAGLRGYTVEALTFASMASFILLPLHMRGQALISSRFLPLVAFLLPGWGRMPRRPLVAAIVALSVFGASAWFHVRVAHNLQAYEHDELGDIAGLLTMLKPTDRLAYLRPDREHPVVDRGASWYLDSYHLVLNGGLNRMPFHVIYPHHTVVVPGHSLPRLDERRPERFPGSNEAAPYTHALVYSHREPRFGKRQDRMVLLGHTGSLWLFRYDAPAPPNPAPPPEDSYPGEDWVTDEALVPFGPQIEAEGLEGMPLREPGEERDDGETGASRVIVPRAGTEPLGTERAGDRAAEHAADHAEDGAGDPPDGGDPPLRQPGAATDPTHRSAHPILKRTK